MQIQISRAHRKIGKNENGIALVWMAILIVVFIGIVGLALDWGYAFWTAQKLQNAADAAALAGARQVMSSHSDARTAAAGIASENEAGERFVKLNLNASNQSDGDIVLGYYNTSTRSFTPTDDSTVNAVNVNAKFSDTSDNGSLGLLWGSFFGRGSTSFTRWAIAVVDYGDSGDGIIALNKTKPQAFYAHGTPSIQINGTIQVNSSNNGAARVSGNTVSISADKVNVNGGNNFNGYTPPSNLFKNNQPVKADPLAGLTAPATGPDKGQINATGTYNAGYYKSGLKVSSSKTIITLNPGIYVLENGFTLSSWDNQGKPRDVLHQSWRG